MSLALSSLVVLIIMQLNSAVVSVEDELNPVNASGYQKPPQEIIDILNAQPTPAVSLSPSRDVLLLIERSGYPPVSDLAAPMLRLAGLRINPETNGPHLAPRNVGFVLQRIPDGGQLRIEVPDGASLGFQGWSPDSRMFAFTVTTTDVIELWIASVKDNRPRRVEGLTLNCAFGVPVQWMPDSSGLLVQAVPDDRGLPPERPRNPTGPVVEQSQGQAGPARTWQDLLQNAHDEQLFDYYCQSQLVRVDATTLRTTAVGTPGMFSHADVSPDGRFILVTRTKRPYSYSLPYSRFARSAELLDIQGNLLHVLADLPLEDRIPIEGVPVGPRSAGWNPVYPGEVYWLEALDDGDPAKKVPHRDRLMCLSAPFTMSPQEVLRTEHRFSGLTWGENGRTALIRDYDRDRRWTRTFLCNLDRVESRELLWERSINDRYSDPGTPILRPLPNGRRVMHEHLGCLFLESAGATPRGDRPFLDRFELTTRKSERLFACSETSHESVVALLSDDGSRFITQYESPVEPPNFFLRSTSGQRTSLTEFPDPMPQLRSIRKELVTYERNDGVPLSFTLYLPPRYQPGTRLPTVVWAYPREFNDPATAGQVSGSTNRFTTIGGISHLFLLTQGYAVLDEATMPVVGLPEVANDTFVQQIVASAEAAVSKAVAMGVTDPERVGIGGHSYGAFMTANLLAHTNLFKAGIARSGAYNRTLTPFGFQNERRTFWEAPQIYLSMSPFAAADRIKTPLLLIHGESDNNPGTFPMQSERLYHAIRGNGGIVRFVTLPHESHSYVARESVEHTLWEMVQWYDQHVKNAAMPR